MEECKPSLGIEYRLSEMDIEYLQWRLLRGYLAAFLVPTFLAVAASLFLLLPHYVLSLAIGFSLGTIVGYTLLMTTMVRYTTWGQIVVLLKPDLLTTAYYPIKSEIVWEEVLRIAEDRQGFYFYLNLLHVVMVPRRVFRTAEEAKTFWALATECYQRAKSVTVATERTQSGR